MSTHTKVPTGIIKSQKKLRRAITALTMDYKQYCRLMWVRRRKGKKRYED